ncbi:hypothetical protein BH11GEM2_BH11GEM2_26000 [soil metagenome]
MAALAATLQLAFPESRAPMTGPRSIDYVRSIGALVNDSPLVLRGESGLATIRLTVPHRARATGGWLRLAFPFRGAMTGDSVLRVSAHGKRRVQLPRSESGADGGARLAIPFDARDIAHGDIVVTVETSLVAVGDRCHEKGESVEVHIDPSSTFTLAIDPASLSVPGAAAELLPDTVALAAPPRTPTVAEFETLLRATAMLQRQGRRVRITRGAGWNASDIVSGAPPILAPRRDNPTFDELAIGNLTRDVPKRAQWRIALDQRMLPVGMVPERVIMKIVATPRLDDRDMAVDMRLDDRALRNVTLRGNGEPRTVRILLPPDAIRLYNELRVDARPRTDLDSACAVPPMTVPWQVMGDSYLVLADAPSTPRQFSTFVAALPATFDLYVPRESRATPEVTIPILANIAQAIWGPLRQPHIIEYDIAHELSPVGNAVVLRAPHGDQSVVRLSRINGHSLLDVIPATHDAVIPATPESYGGGDSVSFASAGTNGGASAPASAAAGQTSRPDTRQKWLTIALLAFAAAGTAARMRARRRTWR